MTYAFVKKFDKFVILWVQPSFLCSESEIFKYESSTLEHPGSPQYLLEEKGAQNCKTGSIILDTLECESACAQLLLELGTAMNNGKPCFKHGGNGRCRQKEDPVGENAFLICKI